MPLLCFDDLITIPRRACAGAGKRLRPCFRTRALVFGCGDGTHDQRAPRRVHAQCARPHSPTVTTNGLRGRGSSDVTTRLPTSPPEVDGAILGDAAPPVPRLRRRQLLLRRRWTPSALTYLEAERAEMEEGARGFVRTRHSMMMTTAYRTLLSLVGQPKWCPGMIDYSVW